MKLEPVHLEQVRGCHWKAKGCKDCGRPKASHKPFDGVCEGFRRQLGCERCGKAKGDPTHFGAPESFNVLASGRGSGNAMVYAGIKQAWQEIFTDLLKRSGLPKGLGGVYVEGEITFPDRREDRDQGNFRVIIEKALGDALEKGGWIPRDDWTRYEFGQLSQRYQPGESATRVTIFPRWERNPAAQDQQQMEIA